MYNFQRDISNWWWWISVILISFLINTISNLLLPKINSLLEKISDKTRKRNQEKQIKREVLITYYKENWLELVIERRFLINRQEILIILLALCLGIISNLPKSLQTFQIELFGMLFSPLTLLIPLHTITTFLLVIRIINLGNRILEFHAIYKLLASLRNKPF